MSKNLKIELLERSLVVDEMIERCRDNIASLSEKIGLERKMLGRHNSEKMRLKKCVSNLNEIHEMLGTSPADMAPPPLPSADVPPPSSVGGGEPIAIEVNHSASIGIFEDISNHSKEKDLFPENNIEWLDAPNSDVEASVPSGSPSKEVTAEASEERLDASTGGKNVDPHNGENHKSRRKRVEQVPQNKNLGHAGKETAAEKIVASLTENADQTIAEVAKKLSVTKPYVSMVCKKFSLKFKRRKVGRTSNAVSARKKAKLAPPSNIKSIASTALTTRPRSMAREKPQPFFEPSKRKVKILHRIVERETGKHLHQDLLGMKK